MKIVRMGSTQSSSGLLMATLWFLNLCVFPLGDKAPYGGLLFGKYTVTFQMFGEHWYFSRTLERLFQHSLRLAASEWCSVCYEEWTP